MESSGTLHLVRDPTYRRPIPRAAAMVGDGDNSDGAGLQTIDQRIWEIVQRDDAGIVRSLPAQRREGCQHGKRLVEFVCEFVGGQKRAFAGVPVDRFAGVGLCLSAKADQHRFWRWRFWPAVLP